MECLQTLNFVPSIKSMLFKTVSKESGAPPKTLPDNLGRPLTYLEILAPNPKLPGIPGPIEKHPQAKQKPVMKRRHSGFLDLLDTLHADIAAKDGIIKSRDEEIQRLREQLAEFRSQHGMTVHHGGSNIYSCDDLEVRTKTVVW